jgi:hypothetical protein
MSMKPNFNPALSLRGGNTEVAAEGPLDWTDSGCCTIEVKITQRVDGHEVVARGESRAYDGPKSTWAAVARIDHPHRFLRPGPAEAWGRVRMTSGQPPAKPEWRKPIELQ